METVLFTDCSSPPTAIRLFIASLNGWKVVLAEALVWIYSMASTSGGLLTLSTHRQQPIPLSDPSVKSTAPPISVSQAILKVSNDKHHVIQKSLQLRPLIAALAKDNACAGIPPLQQRISSDDEAGG